METKKEEKGVDKEETIVNDGNYIDALLELGKKLQGE